MNTRYRHWSRKLARRGTPYLLVLLVGCSGTAQPSQTVSSSPQANVITGETESQGRFKVKLTLTAPDDLKVKEGDRVVAGQILADRVKDRSRLTFQRDNLTREIALLRSRMNTPVPSVQGLPSADFMAEMAEINTARHKAAIATQQREQQQRKLDVLMNLEQSDIPEEVKAHEQVVLEEYQKAADQAQAEVETAAGKLARARELRQQAEYNHALELSKRAIALRDSELKTQTAIADLESQLSQTEIQLSQLSAVRSPYNGRIQRVKFIGQSNTELAVELYLVIGGGGEASRNENRGHSTSADGDRD